MARVFEQGFGIGYKRGVVKKQLKDATKIGRWFKKYPEWVKKALKDIDCFDEQLCDALILADPQDEDYFVSLVNVHLELEAKILNISDFYIEPKVYALGEAKYVFGYESDTVLGV